MNWISCLTCFVATQQFYRIRDCLLALDSTLLLPQEVTIIQVHGTVINQLSNFLSQRLFLYMYFDDVGDIRVTSRARVIRKEHNRGSWYFSSPSFLNLSLGTERGSGIFLCYIPTTKCPYQSTRASLGRSKSK